METEHEITTVFDLSIAQPPGRARPDRVLARESRQHRATSSIFRLLETREELRGVYAPADQIAELLPWSA